MQHGSFRSLSLSLSLSFSPLSSPALNPIRVRPTRLLNLVNPDYPSLSAAASRILLAGLWSLSTVSLKMTVCCSAFPRLPGSRRRPLFFPQFRVWHGTRGAAERDRRVGSVSVRDWIVRTQNIARGAQKARTWPLQPPPWPHNITRGAKRTQRGAEERGRER